MDAEDTWPPSPALAVHRLVLTWGASELEVNEKRPSLTVGRGVLCGITIPSDKVSRLHARIEFHDALFSLTDHSSNGTYIADSPGRTRMVRNETYVLTGAGTISFGINPATGTPLLFKYAVSR
jgi:pSer/pThr/pTyr-binding forkhead associated (FHA) protein